MYRINDLLLKGLMEVEGVLKRFFKSWTLVLQENGNLGGHSEDN
jgi:hypothetical protein